MAVGHENASARGGRSLFGRGGEGMLGLVMEAWVCRGICVVCIVGAMEATLALLFSIAAEI